MPFELFVALRFLREGKAQTALILGGVSMGVAVIVFLSALIGGLQKTLIQQTLGSQAHITLRAPDEAARPLTTGPGVLHLVDPPAQRLRAIDQWQQTVELLRGAEGVIAVSPVAAGAAFASRGNASRSVALRGVDPESFPSIVDLPKAITSGVWRLRGAEAVIGTELASQLGVSVGDKLRINTPEGRDQSFQITGIFDLGNKDVNGRWVLVPLRSAQTLLDLVGGASAIELKVQQIFDAEDIAQGLQRRTGLVADSWMKVNSQLLVGLRSQDSSKTMIQTFVIIAVALGIASVLIVSVVQKSKEIGILKAMGARTGTVMRVFLLQGGIVGAVGAVLGSGLGTLFARFFQALAVNPDGSPRFPADVGVELYAAASLIALCTGLFSAVAPARRAARLDPATVIRNG